ncbi:uncharacterized protein LOC132754891 [Ruditapes philippinarum]|uniref:uncharacterized protein LOC132754891 n=1 Tax=Ruditapes philippinarum TaxID=129788 RepID=UPI00295AF4D8|nr:uncharacterized protein LOC132754891 [Ruditapes philippinarum]
MKNYKSLEAHNLFISGWVQTVFHLEIKGTSNLLMKANVKPSFRVNEDPHQSWVAISKEGDIISAHCDCKAGLGESCSHVAAMLFKVEAAVRNGYTKQACTEQPCAWNKCFTKSVEPATMSAIKFYKESAKQRLLKSKRVRKPPPPPTSKEKQISFLQSLTETETKPVGLSLFKETAYVLKTSSVSNIKRLPQPLTTLYNDVNKKMTPLELQQKCDNVTDSLIVSSDECEYLKQSTVNQSNSETLKLGMSNVLEESQLLLLMMFYTHQ